MTTYPLSEPATLYSDAMKKDVAGQGTLADCAEIIKGLSAETRSSACIVMNDMELELGAAEIDDLLKHLREESAGLSNQEISEIKTAGG